MYDDPDFFVRICNELIVSDNLIISNKKRTVKLKSLVGLPELFRLGWIKKVVPLLDDSDGERLPSTKGLEIEFIEGVEIKDVWGMFKPRDEYDYLKITEPIEVVQHNIAVLHERIMNLFLKELWTEQELVEYAELKLQFNQLDFFRQKLFEGERVAFNEETELFYLVS